MNKRIIIAAVAAIFLFAAMVIAGGPPPGAPTVSDPEAYKGTHEFLDEFLHLLFLIQL